MIDYVVSAPDEALTLDQVRSGASKHALITQAIDVLSFMARVESASHGRLIAQGAPTAAFICLARGAGS